MSEEKKVKKTITEKNLRGKVQALKIQISEQESMAKLLQAKLTETSNVVIVLRGKMVAYAELLAELTGQPIRGARRPAPIPPKQTRKKSTKKKKVEKNKK